MTRREGRLLDIAALKADIIGLYTIINDRKHKVSTPFRMFTTQLFANKYKRIIQSVIFDMEIFLTHRGGRQRLYRIYQNIDRLSAVRLSLLW